jgi:Fur family ferric uptake transcriptional regulator
MTISPDARPLACGNLAEAVAALRDRGLRLSTARRLVLKALFAVDAPVSAEHIAQLENLELTSVYRNLEVLERHGLVRHVHLGHGPGLYALRLHGEPEYLFCERCRAVRAVPSDELDDIRAQVRERYGYEVRFTHFAIVGTCPTCTAAQLHNEHDHEGA